jgi:signal transduction histidine kinase
MPSARSRSTLGFLRRLEVRLVLALASVALVALTVSGIALFQILPSYFVDQAHARLVAAADATASLIKDEPPDHLSPREVREPNLQVIAKSAANNIAQATVEIINVQDGSHAALPASPQRPAELADQGLRPDPQVQPVETSLTIQVPQLDSVAPDGHLKLRVVISNPYTSRAATLDQVRGTLVAAGALALAGSLLVGLLVSRRLTTPINRLRRVSGRLARGDLDQRAPPSSVVEIDQLATQFNGLAVRLSESLRLLQADRDRLREFVADVSHEQRSPIAALRTFTDLQREGTLDDATRAEFLDRSSEQLHRLEWLSTNLLDLSRIDSGIFPLDMHEGDLRDPVRSVVEAHAEMAERRGIALSSAVPGEPVSLRFDRERIVQLVNNLVVNALKFTSRGGHVQVDVRDALGEASGVHSPLTGGLGRRGRAGRGDRLWIAIRDSRHQSGAARGDRHRLIAEPERYRRKPGPCRRVVRGHHRRPQGLAGRRRHPVTFERSRRQRCRIGLHLQRARLDPDQPTRGTGSRPAPGPASRHARV